MRISARCDYACRALLEFSLDWPNEKPLQLKVISKNQNIPERYLVQIISQLKRAGLVDSIRGPAGGYVLKKEPSQIKIVDIIKEICGPLVPVAHSVKESQSVFNNIWTEVEGAIEKTISKVTFDDICKRIRGKEDALFYMI